MDTYSIKNLEHSKQSTISNHNQDLSIVNFCQQFHLQFFDSQLILNQMQEELKSIVKRFKQTDIHILLANKENFPSNNKESTKQQLYKSSNPPKIFRDVVQSLIADGNRMHLCYEQLIHQANIHFQELKQQLAVSRHSQEQEKAEAEKIISELNAKIDLLSKEMAHKEESYREILEKYDQLIEHADQVHMEESKQVKQLQSERLRESMHFQHEIKLSFKEIDDVRCQLVQSLETVEQLTKQNAQLKSRNQRLTEHNEYLQGKLDAQKFHKLVRLQNREDEEQSLPSMEPYDTDSLSKESKFGTEQLKRENSQSVNFIEEKELLNISEHYSKFNRTQELHCREKEGEIDFNDTNSIVKKYQTSKNALAKIGDLFQRDSPEHHSSHAQDAVRQFQQQKQKWMSAYENQIVDPYRAFFQLLTQCEKLNSPFFDRISHIDVSFLYEEMIARFIPHNLWQAEIKKLLDSKIRQK